MRTLPGGGFMKAKFLVTALACASFFAQLPRASADRIIIRPAGPEVPFPLKIQMPFHWETIEGVYEAKGPGIDALFSFKTQSDLQNGRTLVVHQLDPETKVVLAQGLGLTAGDDMRNVRVAMTSKQGGRYWMTIRAFKQSGGHQNEIATVLTIKSFTGRFDESNIVACKISEAPYADPRSVVGSAPRDNSIIRRSY